MRVSVERLPGSTVAVDIFSDQDEFDAAMNKTFQKISREIAIPGFRRGKAPRHLVERMVGREYILQQAGGDMMDDLYRRAIEQESLVPVSEPEVELIQAEPLAFKVKVEVFPTIDIGDYRSIRVEPREVEIEEGEVETVLESLQKQHSEWVEVDPPRRPGEGNQVIIDLNVYEGEDVFQEPATDATFVLGESPMFESLVEALKMMMPGSSSELTLAFEEDDMSVNPELRGKELRYEVNLKQVLERQLPALDDELARKTGDFETFEAMRSTIERDLLRNKAAEARNEVVTEIINAIAGQATVEIPSAMIDREVEDEITQLRSRLASQRLSFEDYLSFNNQTEDDLREEFRPDAVRRVRNSVVLQEIAKAEQVEVSDEDIEAEIDRLSAPSQNPDRLRTLYSSDYFRGLLRDELFNRGLTERLIEIATEGRGTVTGSGAAALAEPEPEPAGAVEADAADGEQSIEAVEPAVETSVEPAETAGADADPAAVTTEDEAVVESES